MMTMKISNCEISRNRFVSQSLVYGKGENQNVIFEKSGNKKICNRIWNVYGGGSGIGNVSKSWGGNLCIGNLCGSIDSLFAFYGKKISGYL